MKPDWDKLMDEFKNSKSAGIYDVDCTASGKELCEKVGVSGYPTIKYGDPSSMDKLTAYEGGRDFESLKKFAEENLGPVCGPKSLDVCDDAEKAIIEASMAKPLNELIAEIGKLDKDFSAKTKQFQKKKRKFTQKYSEFQEELGEFKSETFNFEKTKAKLSGAALKDKEKKMSARTEKFDKKEKAIEAEKAKFDEEEEALNAEIKASGLKLMKAVKASRPKEEL